MYKLSNSIDFFNFLNLLQKSPNKEGINTSLLEPLNADPPLPPPPAPPPPPGCGGFPQPPPFPGKITVTAYFSKCYENCFNLWSSMLAAFGRLC